ncbi:MAG: hypothetical protein ACK5LJ_08350 [Paracoccus sp. (in: a-proteobacteria)]
MTVQTRQVAVGTTATLLSTGLDDYTSGRTVEIVNPSTSGGPIYLGGADVTTTGTTKGRELVAGASGYAVDLNGADQLYAIVATGTVTVTVTQTGVA